jgi:hypothetical protein
MRGRSAPCSIGCDPHSGWQTTAKDPLPDGGNRRILLKNSETERLRKSRIRAPRVTSADSPYGRAYRRVPVAKTGQSAEPLRNFASRLPAVF